MSMQPPDVEREWAAEKRDFVSDRRDQLAAERDAAADARDATADRRQADGDDRERQLDSRDAAHGLADTVEAAASRDGAGLRRERAGRDRDDVGVARDAAAAARDKATRRRQQATPTTRLASAFADIAEHLYDAETFDDVLLRIAHAAVTTVAGCQMASVTLSERGAYQTAATTASAASAVDQAQYDAGEGPSLDAVDAPIVYARSFPDTRWPALASHPAEVGAQSAVSYRLSSASLTTAGTGGSLNTYGDEPDAFSDDARNIGLILAAHASMAAGSVHEREALQKLAVNLNKALLSRDVIGQAKGILMERLKLTPEDAFDALRHSSQQLNEKLREVALRLSQTGELEAGEVPGAGRRSAAAGR